MKKLNLCIMAVLLIAAGLVLAPRAMAAVKAEGSCGNGGKVKWSLSNSGTLTISGKGAMDDWSADDNTPWYPYAEEIKKIVVKDGVTAIGIRAFQGLGYMDEWDEEDYTPVSADIAGSVTKIGDFAFLASTIEKITLPASVTSIGTGVFMHCYYLKEVTLPDGITAVPDYTFAYACSFTKDDFGIVIPEGVTAIGSSAFYYFGNYEQETECVGTPAEVGTATGDIYIALPSTLKTIGENAFMISAFEAAYYQGTKKDWKSVSFDKSTNPRLNAILHFNPFRDVKGDKAYMPAVVWAFENGITKGTSSTTFSPSRGLTRGEFCTMLWRMWGRPKVSAADIAAMPFADAKKSNHKEGIAWCYKQGIISGMQENGKKVFKPGNSLTRGNILIMLFKLAKKDDGYVKPTIQNPFKDIKTNNKNYTAYLWAYENGITTTKTLKPGDACKRSAMVSFLYGYEMSYHVVRQ